MDQIFSLRIITENFLAVNQKVFCAFVDLEKAFDRRCKSEIMGDTTPVQCERTLAAGRKETLLQKLLNLLASRSWHVALV